MSDCEGGKRNKHVLKGAAMGSLVMNTFSKFSPAQGFLRCLADVACSNGAVDRDLWLSIALQCFSCALV